MSSLLSYQAQLQQYTITVNALRDELALYIEKDSIPDTNSLQMLIMQITAQQYYEIPFEKTRTYAIVFKNIQLMQYNIDVMDNRTLPQMDVTASVTRKNYSSSQDNVMRSLPDTDYSIGVVFTYPLGNHYNTAQLKEYELSLKELRHTLDLSKNNYYKALRTVLGAIQGYAQLLETHKKYLEVLIQKQKIEQRKYEQARIDLQYVIDTQNSIAAEKLILQQLQVGLIGYWIDYQDLVQ
ncbi:MAG: TolC family protein [Spirochaetota bacterium]